MINNILVTKCSLLKTVYIIKSKNNSVKKRVEAGGLQEKKKKNEYSTFPVMLQRQIK